MLQLSRWREEMTFMFNVSAVAGFLVYFLFLTINGHQTLARARFFLSRIVQPDTHISEESRSALDDSRLRAFRAYNSCVLLGVGIIRLVRLALAARSPVGQKAEHDDAFGLPWLFAGIIFDIFPRTMTVRRFEGLFIVATSAFACERLIGAQYSPGCEVSQIVFRVASSIVVCNPRLVLGMNVLTTVGNLINHTVYNPHPMYGTMELAREAELSVFIAATALSYYSHFCVVRCALLQSELQAALKAQAPLRSLLARWCDVTVELGSDLRMRQHSVNLAALLFRTSSCLQGALFEDILHRSDRLRFAQIVASCSAMGSTATHASPAQVFSVSLLDRSGRAVPVQLVHTCIRDGDGDADCCHVIGIREEDAESHAERPLPAIRPVDASDVAARVIGAVSDDGSQPSGTIERVPSSPSSTGNSSGGSSVSSGTWFNIADVHVDLDVSSTELEIVDASEAFIELGGSETIGSSFSSWVSGHKRLTNWLQSVINSLVHDDERLPEYNCSLRFKTPMATCRAAGVAVYVEDTEDLQETFRVRLLLHGVQAANHGASRIASPRRGSSTRASL